jgi:hypothetical protein
MCARTVTIPAPPVRAGPTAHWSSLSAGVGHRWAGCGLLSLSLFGIVLLGKVITIILGAVWILSQDGKQCVSGVDAPPPMRAAL